MRACTLPAMRRSLTIALTTLATLASQGSAAQSKDAPPAGPTFSADVAVGAEYDTNVSVEEVDATSGEEDYALLVDLGAGVDIPLGQSADLSITYDLGNAKYDEFSQVDRQTHILGTDFAVDLGDVNTGLSAYYINARLDGEAFLELWRLSPSVSGFLSKRWFGRAAYVYLEKTIEDRPERDALAHAGELDVYFFRRGLRSYFNVGYQFREEDAEAERFDFQSHNLKVRYIQRFEMFSLLNKLELAWRYEDRDFTGVTPSIGEEREESRSRWKVDVEIPLTQRFTWQIYGGYGDYDSNLPVADYTQTIVGTRMLYSW